MQIKEVKAFRQRLIRAGFKVNYIYRYGSLYDVSVIAPNGERIERCMSVIEMNNTPHLVWFD